jgi:hypothetical protein
VLSSNYLLSLAGVRAQSAGWIPAGWVSFIIQSGDFTSKKDNFSEDDKMHKIRMIYNPEADRGRSYQVAGDLRQLSAEWGGADWIGTDYPGHASELAAAAAAAGYETVVALGGGRDRA